MAAAVLAVVLGKLESLAGVLAGQEFSLLAGVYTEVRKLKSTLELTGAFLEDAGARQMHQRSVKAWMDALKDIMYDTEDVLDDWNTTRVDDGTGIPNKVFIYLLSYCSCLQPVYSCLFGDRFWPADVSRIAHKIKDIRDRLDSLTRDKNQLGLVVIPTQEGNHPRRWTSSLVDQSQICGREDDKRTILSWLRGESSQQNIRVPVPVISIVGMGGLGKTTLAQIICKEDAIASTFSLMWVCVSEAFDLRGVIQEITERAGGPSANNDLSVEALLQGLGTSVQGKRFLLVLDDVWSEDPYDWDPIKLSLSEGKPGSRIIVTTRNDGVADMMGSAYTHRLQQLPDADCFSLFWKIVFSRRPQEELHKFRRIGEDIAKKCKGVPLAVKTMASIMWRKRTVQDWENVLVSGVWEFKLIKQSLLPALLLSYYDLPTSLKQCFSYCAIFPKDTVFFKVELVKQWMAQGYLGLAGDDELELCGVQYFEDLAMRSFFQDFKKDHGGNIICCKMHDLVHDLAQFLTESECTIVLKNVTPPGISNMRHINAWNVDNPSILKSRNLRSLMCRPSQSHILELCNNMRYLRVLSFIQPSIGSLSFEVLPDEVGGLSHLRYIDLSCNCDLRKLPKTMCNLYSLQTLKLNFCKSLRGLPGKLSNLRHLEIFDTDEVRYLPKSLGKLSQLRTLSKFIVSGAGEGCGIEELRSFKHLRGTLEIEGLKHVGGIDEAKRAELWRKKDFAYLKFEFDDPLRDDPFHVHPVEFVTEEDMKRMESTLEGLQPDAYLDELVISGYGGLIFPSWISNIATLELSNCCNCLELPAFGSFKFLEALKIKGLKSLKHTELHVAASGNRESKNLVLFPELKLLGLLDLPNWEEEIEETTASTSAGTSIMPCLQELRIFRCHKLKVVPFFLFPQSLRKLHISDCPQLTGVQPCLPLLLKELRLDGDVGVLSQSTLPIPHHSNTTYPNLNSVIIQRSPHFSLPQGLNKFTSLQELCIWDCKDLDMTPEEDLRHFPLLQVLKISGCPIIEERCSREDWRTILCHQIPYCIKIDGKTI